MQCFAQYKNKYKLFTRAPSNKIVPHSESQIEERLRNNEQTF